MKQLNFHFYDTIGLSEEEWVKEETNAINQEERVYRIFQTYRAGTPSEIMKRYDEIWPSVPITSIRRSITNLTREGKLEMTGEMFTGMYGKPEHQWKIK